MEVKTEITLEAQQNCYRKKNISSPYDFCFDFCFFDSNVVPNPTGVLPVDLTDGPLVSAAFPSEAFPF
jgi:hypothetical protein